jgi:hypothetical protein
MRRVVRAVLLAFLASLVGVMASASNEGNAPIVFTLSPVSGPTAYITSPGQQIIVNGSHLSSDLFPSNCQSFNYVPVVHFEALNSSGQIVNDVPVGPASAASSDCSNTFVKVTVPAGIPGGARIKVIDHGGRASNDNLQITIQPTAVISPGSGQVGTAASINATNGTTLHPSTVVANSKLHLVYPGVDSQLPGWGDQIGFSPGNSSGSAQLSFLVNIDLNNLNDPNAQQAVTVNAPSYQFLPPATVSPTGSGDTITGKVVGDQLTINGANLGSGGSVAFAGGVHGQSLSWSSTGVGVSIPVGAQDGPLSLLVNGYGPVVAGPTLKINPLVKAMSPASGSAGTPVTISGYNFGAAAGKVTAGGAVQTVTSWADQAIAFSLSSDTDSGAVTITRADGVGAAAPSVNIVPRLDKLETNNLKAGAAVVIDGVSLGAATGTAKVGTVDAKPQLWSRSSVLLTVPASLAAGTYPVVLTSAAGTASNALSLVIVPGPAATPPPSSAAGGHAPSTFIDNNHQFHKPPKTDSPVQLSLTAASHQLKAGGTSDLTVTLTLNGKPVSGADIKLRMLLTPGNDFKFTPETGTTDATGTFKARVTISKTNGDTVIQAESGIFSDQDHITGSGGNVALSTVNPAANTGGIVPLVALGVVALLLVGLGVWLNLRSGRTAAA